MKKKSIENLETLKSAEMLINLRPQIGALIEFPVSVKGKRRRMGVSQTIIEAIRSGRRLRLMERRGTNDSGEIVVVRRPMGDSDRVVEVVAPPLENEGEASESEGKEG